MSKPRLWRPRSRLKSKWFPEQNSPDRPRRLAGYTARDIVDAAYAIKADEYEKKRRRYEEKQKAAVANVSLAIMPWDKKP